MYRKSLLATLITLPLSLLLFFPISFAGDKASITTRIGYLPITDHLILGIAQSQKKEELKPLQLQSIRFTDWATLAESVRSGDLEGAFLLAPLAYRLKAAKTPIKLVLLGHRDGSALIVKVRPEIKTVEDLRGRTLAIPHRYSTHNMLLHLYMTEAGLKYGKDFKVIEMAPPEMVAALSRGDIDGYIVAEPFGARGELEGGGRILVLSSQIWKHHPDCVLVLREEYLKQSPESAQVLINQLVWAGGFAEEHREEAAKIGASFLKQPLNAMSKAMLEPKDRVTFLNLTPDIGDLKKLHDYMVTTMQLLSPIKMEEFVDSHYAKTAYKALSKEPESKKNP